MQTTVDQVIADSYFPCRTSFSYFRWSKWLLRTIVTGQSFKEQILTSHAPLQQGAKKRRILRMQEHMEDVDDEEDEEDDDDVFEPFWLKIISGMS